MKSKLELFNTFEKYGDIKVLDHDDGGMAVLWRYRGKKKLWMVKIIASWEGGWDHVSVSLDGITPSWKIMSDIKDLFFHDTETVMQLHPPKDDHINIHPYCLHLWRPHDAEIPMPPKEFV